MDFRERLQMMKTCGMAKRQFQVSEQAIGHFRQAEGQTRDAHELKRLPAVRLYGGGTGLAEIRQMGGCGESTVRQWAMRYNAQGLTGLRSQWKGGNANKLSAEQSAVLKEKLHQYRPVDLQLSQATYWTVSDVQTAVVQWFGVSYNDVDSYHGLLRRCGFSYQRTAKVYRSQPSAADVAEFETELEKK
jgi:putative transposase